MQAGLHEVRDEECRQGCMKSRQLSAGISASKTLSRTARRPELQLLSLLQLHPPPLAGGRRLGTVPAWPFVKNFNFGEKHEFS